MTRQRRGMRLNRGRQSFRSHRPHGDPIGRVLRVTIWEPDREEFVREALSLVAAEDAMKPGITLEAISREFRLKEKGAASGLDEGMDTHTFITTQIIRIAHTSDDERNLQLALEHRDAEAEHAQAVLFYWTCFQLSTRVRSGGALSHSKRSPLSAGQIEDVWQQVAITEFFDRHTCIAFSRDGQTVTLHPTGLVDVKDGSPV
jgi:hypothetical protein